MANIRSINEIILSMIDFFKLAQPDLDTKPGSVARDAFIDAPAAQISTLYDELSGIANKQSLRLVVGSDLDKLAKNFGVIRKQSTPSSGAAILTFSSINATININRGDTVIANNGFSYTVSAGIAVVPSAINFYRSVANRYRDQLDFAGISDTLAVQVTVIATSPGSTGNIGTYQLNRTGIPGVSNVTNVTPFNGGTDQETDAAFRSRVLATFSGSSVGTALGYLNVALGTTGVSDAYVVEPGDPLMTRDGTIVSVASDGTRTIESEGSGGKVDVIIAGSTLIENSDSFIYQDKSNNNDPSNIKNNIVLGQIPGDTNKTINRKRIDDIKNGTLPAQPVDGVLQVTGSISGSNFAVKEVDTYGRVSGNYELLKDTGVYGGSPFGFDTFHWISNKVSLFTEDRIKGQFNGQDATTFTDVLEIPQIQQSVSITNENSMVSSDRSIIQLLHTPVTNVTRVFNVNTGERYIITNQNLDQTGSFNETGRIQISGNTLPSPSDQLQVDYNWIVNFDQYSDYDGLKYTSNPRPVTDSIDWGYASSVKKERVHFTQAAGTNYFLGSTQDPITTVISASGFSSVDTTAVKVTSGNFINRISIVIEHLPALITSVNSIKLKNSNVELYNTNQKNGTFTSTTQVVGINILYVLTIILPTDTVAVEGDEVDVIFNTVNVFSSTTQSGSASGRQITIPASLVNSIASDVVLEVTYIANISDLFSSATVSLPASRAGNGYVLNNNNGFNNFSIVNCSRRENQVVQKNLSNQFYVELNLPAVDFSLNVNQVISIIRLTDGYELWSSNHPGTITTSLGGNYQLILSGINSPVISDRVLVVYYATDLKRFQPFSFSNELIKTKISTLGIDPGTGKFSIPLTGFTNQSNLIFSIQDADSNTIWMSGTDGVIVSQTDGSAHFTSAAVNFALLADLTNKKLKIQSPVVGNTNFNNDGIYDILSYDQGTDTITCNNIVSNISKDQIGVVRLLDGQELWNYSGIISGNKLLIPTSEAAQIGDRVYVTLFNFKNLNKAPTRLIATTVDQIVNTGIITIAGTTLAKAQDIIFTATNTGLKLNLAEALRKDLNLNSTSSLPSNVKIAKIIKVEKVATASSTDDTVLEVLATYDTSNTTIQNNLFYADEMLTDPTLLNLDFVLPGTTNNTVNTVPNNLPSLGDKIRITFYYVTEGDTENLSYSRNGTLYTNKLFALINRIYVSSGFKASQSTRLTVSLFTQPSLGARYKVFYDYAAPKQNERVVVRYNYNKLISDATFNIEAARPINADVLVRGAKDILLDLTMNVVIDPTMLSSTATIIQNLRNQLVSALTTTQLGQIIDQITLINIAQSINGITRARILYFNKSGGVGQILKFQAQKDELFSANSVVINTETR